MFDPFNNLPRFVSIMLCNKLPCHTMRRASSLEGFAADFSALITGYIVFLARRDKCKPQTGFS